MIKDLVFYTLYEACNSYYTKNNPRYRYNNVIGLILIILSFHFLQVFALVKKDFVSAFKSITGIHIVLFFVLFLLLFYLIEKIFPKKDLPRVLRLYKGSSISKYAKLILYSYVFLNIGLLVLIAWLKK